jgi:hypothetical protein
MKPQMIDPDRMEVPPRALRLKVRGRMPIPYGDVVRKWRRLTEFALRRWIPEFRR